MIRQHGVMCMAVCFTLHGHDLGVLSELEKPLNENETNKDDRNRQREQRGYVERR